MNENRKLSDQDSWLAAEYALGVLGSEQIADAEKKAANDEVFRSTVEGWNSQLSPMLDSIEEVQPPSSVWSNIELTLQPASIAEESSSDGIGFWKLVSAFTSTVAVACVGMLMYFTGGDFTGSEIAGVKQELALVRSEADQAKERLVAAREEITQFSEALNDKDSELAEVGSKVVELVDVLGVLKENSATQQERLANLRTAVSNYKSSLQNRADRIAELRTDLNEARGTIRSDKQLLAENRSMLASTRAELQEAQNSLELANSKFAQLSSQIQVTRPLVASLTQSGDAPAFVAQYDPLKKALLIRTDVSDDDEKVPEVWLIPAQGDREGEVLSLGVMNEAAPDTLPISEDFVALIGEGGTLAITMEPPGGAPNGVATGPVIALGKLQAF